MITMPMRSIWSDEISTNRFILKRELRPHALRSFTIVVIRITSLIDWPLNQSRSHRRAQR
jgi:hypothetical protein